MIRRSALWPHVYLRSNALRVTIASDGRNMDRVSGDGRLDLMGAGSSCQCLYASAHVVSCRVING
jgi:hypothetical protein